MTWSNKWLYTPPAAATTAFTGKVIASTDWNTIHTDLSNALTQIGQQYIVLTGVNFNSVADTTVNVAFPSNMTTYQIDSIVIGTASQTLSTATCGVFTGAGATGTTIVAANTTITVTSASANTNNNSQSLTVINQGTTQWNLASFFFRVQNAEGAAATGNVVVHLKFMP